MTVHDLSFERTELMGPLDRLTFRAFVPRAGRRPTTCSRSRSGRSATLERYGLAEDKVTVTPNGVDPAFAPGGAHDGYLLFVGAIQARAIR